jgi:hypothetical protein
MIAGVVIAFGPMRNSPVKVTPGICAKIAPGWVRRKSTIAKHYETWNAVWA